MGLDTRGPLVALVGLALVLAASWQAECSTQAEGAWQGGRGDAWTEEGGAWGHRRQLAPARRLHVFDLTDFGGVGNGEADNTRAFQNAVYAVSGVADKGGGQLYVPPGRFLTGSFNLTSNMTLYLAKDAVILGSTNIKKWPLLAPLPSYGRGREKPGPRHSSLLYGQGLEDVIISGENGTIDGQGQVWWDMASNGTLNHTRGSLIELLWSNKIHVANITLLNSPYWTVHPVYSSEVIVRNVTILAPTLALKVDGVDPDSCSDVWVEDLYVSTGGDAIAIKSGWDEYGVSYAHPSTNIHIRNIEASTPNGAGIAIGSEMSGGVSNVSVTGIRVFDSLYGLHVKTCSGRGGYISNVVISNISMYRVETAIGFSSHCDEHPDKGYDPQALPVVGHICIKDVIGQEIGQAGELDGISNSPFHCIELANVTLKLRPGGLGYNCEFVAGCSQACDPTPCKELSPRTDMTEISPASGPGMEQEDVLYGREQRAILMEV